MPHQVISRDGLTISVFRYGFLRPGFFCAAHDAAGNRVAFTGVFAGKGSKSRAIEAAVIEAKTGRPAPNDRGCPG